MTLVVLLFVSCSEEFEYGHTPQSVETLEVTNITESSAKLGGKINSIGNGTLIQSGIAVGTVKEPSWKGMIVENDIKGLGEFHINAIELQSGTTYYIRTFAYNGKGVAYGKEISFTTSPAPPAVNLPSVTIGSQIWTDKNLNVETYSDGTIIPQVTDLTAWGKLTTGAWCYYANNTANGVTYGKLYNWYAVKGIYDEASKTDVSKRKKLAPSGWHVPTNAEWTTLTTYLGGDNVASGKMKATTTWSSFPSITNTNSSGFTALPAGILNGSFSNVLYTTWFWSSSENVSDATQMWFIQLDYSNNACQRRLGSTVGGSGMYVRCIKN
jgi:uncharacterized protein (TIGR02145 family)